MSALERLGIHVDTKADPPEVSPSQTQTRDTFSYKWARRNTYDVAAVQEVSRKWLLERYCGGNATVVRRWLEGERKIILDAGCGSGFSALLLFGDCLREHDYLGVDISDSVNVARERFREAGITADFLQSDLNAMPVPDQTIDLLFSEGVLHHTDDTRISFLSLSRKLKSGGRFLFYVYAKKAPLREFADDHVRAQLRDLSDEDAWHALEPLTALGKSLGEMNVQISVPDDVSLLGIPKGNYDLQRFFYWYIFKAYYRPEYSLEAMNHINFDWYRPQNCHRHTAEEVQEWCSAAGLSIECMNVQEAGITVVAIKP